MLINDEFAVQNWCAFGNCRCGREIPNSPGCTRGLLGHLFSGYCDITCHHQPLHLCNSVDHNFFPLVNLLISLSNYDQEARRHRRFYLRDENDSAIWPKCSAKIVTADQILCNNARKSDIMYHQSSSVIWHRKQEEQDASDTFDSFSDFAITMFCVPNTTPSPRCVCCISVR